MKFVAALVFSSILSIAYSGKKSLDFFLNLLNINIFFLIRIGLQWRTRTSFSCDPRLSYELSIIRKSALHVFNYERLVSVLWGNN
jgi:hypothetical protein